MAKKIFVLAMLLCIVKFGYSCWWEDIEDFADQYDIAYNEYDDFEDFMANASDEAVESLWDYIDNNDGYLGYEVDYDYSDYGFAISDITVIGTIPIILDQYDEWLGDEYTWEEYINNWDDFLDDCYIAQNQTNPEPPLEPDLDLIYYNNGIQMLDILEAKLAQDQACVYEIDNTTGALLNASSLAITAKSESMLIISALKADLGFVKAIGSKLGYAGIALNTTQFVMGIWDGEAETVDWVNLGTAVATGVTLVAGSVPVIITAGVVSIGLGIYSAYLSECNQN